VTPSTRFALEELQSARGFTLTRENWEALFTTVDGLYKFHKYLKKKNGNEVLIAVLERLLFAIAEEGAAVPAKEGEEGEEGEEEEEEEEEDDEEMPKGLQWKTILSTYQSMKKIKNGFSNGACETKKLLFWKRLCGRPCSVWCCRCTARHLLGRVPLNWRKGPQLLRAFAHGPTRAYRWPALPSGH
jgi:hypothetical protein